MKASELIGILKDRIAKHGDLDVSCDTQDGGSYAVGSVDVVKWTAADSTSHFEFLIQ